MYHRTKSVQSSNHLDRFIYIFNQFIHYSTIITIFTNPRYHLKTNFEIMLQLILKKITSSIFLETSSYNSSYFTNVDSSPYKSAQFHSMAFPFFHYKIFQFHIFPIFHSFRLYTFIFLHQLILSISLHINTFVLEIFFIPLAFSFVFFLLIFVTLCLLFAVEYLHFFLTSFVCFFCFVIT